MNFCFVLENQLSASSQPGKNKRMSFYLDLYKENNIKVLISLYKKIQLPEEYKDKFQVYYFFLDEYETPTVEQIDEVVDVIIKHIQKKEAVNVNCAAGISNSAMLLVAAIMKFKNYEFQKAFDIVAENRYAIEESEKVARLKQYEKFIEKNRKPKKRK